MEPSVLGLSAELSARVNANDPRSLFSLGACIGEGTYGEVREATVKASGRRLAVKILEEVHEIVEELEEETRTLAELSEHPNLPSYHGVFLASVTKHAQPEPKTQRRRPPRSQVWIAMELCEGGSVTELARSQIRSGRRLPEAVIAYILRETMQGISHLHQHRVMHRDVKGHNILLTRDAEIRLVDFGVSCHLKDVLARRNTSVGTPYWMSPEVIACEHQADVRYDVRADVWSLGITAIELAEGRPPLAEFPPLKALFKIPREPPPRLRETGGWSEAFRDFVRRCLVKDFERRPFIGDLLRHPFIKNVKHTSEVRRTVMGLLAQKDGGSLAVPDVTTKHGQLKSSRQWRPDAGEDALSDECLPSDDLARLETLDETSVVEALFSRFTAGRVYTYIGDILLAVNPCKPLPSLYSPQAAKRYLLSGKSDRAPHVFAVADQAFQAMLHTARNQCIVISGESGAGKTKSANFLVQQLTALGKARSCYLEDRILQVDPLIEAFGNAATVINANSSRFGKFLELHFTPAGGRVTGGCLSEYLLEKSRVVQQNPREKNFHVFYYALFGLRERVFAIDPGRKFRYLCDDYRQIRGSTFSAEDVNYFKLQFNVLRTCFEVIGFREKEVEAVYRILAAILHLGNVDFEVQETREHSHRCRIPNQSVLGQVGRLLCVEAGELDAALTSSELMARGETIVRQNSVGDACTARDAMAKALYGRLFSWIVHRVNAQLCPPGADREEHLAVGILDIFGFENFAKNSFEQLCINLANEQIQYYFNQHVFAWEMQEYRNEGVEASEDISFVDNKALLEMFLAKPLGLLALLDEESSLARATDASLLEKFNANIRSPNFMRPKSNTSLHFSIAHYAGKVQYECRGFLDKNRDRLPNEIVTVLRGADLALVRMLFQAVITQSGNPGHFSCSTSATNSTLVSSAPSLGSMTAISVKTSAKTSSSATAQLRGHQTVASYFRYSLLDLLNKMVNGSPHFVRCIRPNAQNSAHKFDPEKVRQQLRYTGVLETTRIRRAGYSHRLLFADFVRKYHILAFRFVPDILVSRDMCQEILERLCLRRWALGRNKVFLKYYHMEEMAQRHDLLSERALHIQALVRGFLARRRCRRLLQRRVGAAVVLQKYVRGFLARRRVLPMLRQRRRSLLRARDEADRLQQLQQQMAAADKENAPVSQGGDAAWWSLSEARRAHGRRMQQRKRPLSQRQASYYRAAAGQHRARSSGGQANTKSVVQNRQHLAYYEQAAGLAAFVLRTAVSLNGPQRPDQALAAVHEAKRTILAAAAARAILANKPRGADASMAWDAPIRKAEEQIFSGQSGDKSRIE